MSDDNGEELVFASGPIFSVNGIGTDPNTGEVLYEPGMDREEEHPGRWLSKDDDLELMSHSSTIHVQLQGLIEARDYARQLEAENDKLSLGPKVWHDQYLACEEENQQLKARVAELIKENAELNAERFEARQELWAVEKELANDR